MIFGLFRTVATAPTEDSSLSMAMNKDAKRAPKAGVSVLHIGSFQASI